MQNKSDLRKNKEKEQTNLVPVPMKDTPAHTSLLKRTDTYTHIYRDIISKVGGTECLVLYQFFFSVNPERW